MISFLNVKGIRISKILRLASFIRGVKSVACRFSPDPQR
jgi:hypothetical protein